MRPISDINIGDQYKKNIDSNIIYSVHRINLQEKMVEIQAYNKDAHPVSIPWWTKNNSGLFKERIFNGKTNKFEGSYL